MLSIPKLTMMKSVPHPLYYSKDKSRPGQKWEPWARKSVWVSPTAEGIRVLGPLSVVSQAHKQTGGAMVLSSLDWNLDKGWGHRKGKLNPRAAMPSPTTLKLGIYATLNLKDFTHYEKILFSHLLICWLTFLCLARVLDKSVQITFNKLPCLIYCHFIYFLTTDLIH